MQKKLLLTITDFIAEYTVSRSVFYNEIKKGALKPTKLGARIYVKREDADEWLKSLGD